MTSLEAIAIGGGLLIGYVIVWAFIGRNKEKPFIDSEHTEKSSDSNQYRSSYKRKKSTSHENYSDAYEETANKEEIRIFSCPSCKQKIRVTLPLLGGVGKCAKCNGSFGISVDDDGNLYIAELNNSQANYKTNIDSLEECFTILGLIEGASSEDIKSAYRRKMKEYHPDKVANLGEKLKAIADIETKKLNAAYAMLKGAGYVNNAQQLVQADAAKRRRLPWSLGSKGGNCMSNKKCHNCGVVDSVHRKDEGRSKLVWAFGPNDDDGLQMHFIYCRACGFVNIYKPGWFGNIKYNSCMDAREIYKAFQNGKMRREEMGMFAGKLQQAMVEDGILPSDWEIV